jgi:hypothetical protein
VKNPLIYLCFLSVAATAIWLRNFIRQRRSAPTPSPAPALPPDIIQRVHLEFPETAEKVLGQLSELRAQDSRLFGDRVTRCIVFCPRHYPGTTIEHWIEQARLDYRDLITAAEHDRTGIHRRDFNHPFRNEYFTAEHRNAPDSEVV